MVCHAVTKITDHGELIIYNNNNNNNNNVCMLYYNVLITYNVYVDHGALAQVRRRVVEDLGDLGGHACCDSCDNI